MDLQLSDCDHSCWAAAGLALSRQGFLGDGLLMIDLLAVIQVHGELRRIPADSSTELTPRFR